MDSSSSSSGLKDRSPRELQEIFTLRLPSPGDDGPESEAYWNTIRRCRRCRKLYTEAEQQVKFF